jgi:gliding motility-associated-like protein
MKGQVNLVPNPSFEDTIGACQIQMGVSSLGAKIKNWYTCYVGSTPDCYNMCVNSLAYPTICSVPYNCRTYQMPRTGEAFLGLWTYSVMDALDSSKIESENIAVKLATPLKPNVCYYGEFYANLGNISNVAINQLGMLLTSNIYTTTVGSFTNTINPQIQWDTTYWFTDTLNWVKISGTFIAQGGEEYLTIGNFRDGLHLNKKSILSNFVTGGCSIINTFKNYFLIDDVALYEIPPPQLQENEVTICPDSDSLLLGDTARIQTSYQWYENGIAIDTTSYIKVKPGQTTTYVLQSTSCATTSQTIVVTYSANCTPPEPIEVVEPIIPNVFSPNNDNINDVWRFHLGKGNSLKSLSIFNRWGNDVTPSFYEQEKQNVSTVLWDGRTTSGEPVSSGVYFYVLQYTDAMGEQHKKNGYITLIR